MDDDGDEQTVYADVRDYVEEKKKIVHLVRV